MQATDYFITLGKNWEEIDLLVYFIIDEDEDVMGTVDIRNKQTITPEITEMSRMTEFRDELHVAASVIATLGRFYDTPELEELHEGGEIPLYLV